MTKAVPGAEGDLVEQVLGHERPETSRQPPRTAGGDATEADDIVPQ